MRLTIIRHGTTAWNRDARYQGWRDVPLDETGEREAVALRDRLAGERFDAVISSDLGRCLTTARLALPDASIETDPGLRELRFGDWEGRTYTECLAAAPDAFPRWMRDPAATTPPGGESLLEFETRIYQTVDAIAARHATAPDARIAVVTHGGVLRALARRASGVDAAAGYAIAIPNCAVARLVYAADGSTTFTLDDA